MKGYFDDPDTTATVFAGGWFHSGDVAVMRRDGYIELRDRKKDLIISGGENISTIEVEHTICRHLALLECALVAIPDEKWSERPKAFVTVASDCTPTSGKPSLLPGTPGSPQTAGRGRLRHAPQDLDRKGSKVRR